MVRTAMAWVLLTSIAGAIEPTAELVEQLADAHHEAWREERETLALATKKVAAAEALPVPKFASGRKSRERKAIAEAKRDHAVALANLEVNQSKERLAPLAAGRFPPLAPLFVARTDEDFFAVPVGKIGSLHNQPVRVLQILDSGAMLIRIGSDARQAVAMLEAATEGLTDDALLDFDDQQLFEATGTFRYEGALGTRTVIALEEVDMRPVRTEIRRRMQAALKQ